MEMLARFQRFIEERELFAPDAHVLLAVSGGMDSVTLCELMSRAGYRFTIAHCNFHLRPGDCDRDERFVRDMASRYGVPCRVASFETVEYAQKESLSIEAAARQLRYAFFEYLRCREGFDCVATGHHRDDATETFFLNLLRGTGISGLHGIRPRRGHVVRPLLPFGRDEISAFVSANGLQYVEDCTNASTEFRRNAIRHELMPLLRTMAPAIDRTMQQTIAHLADAELIYRQRIDAESVRLWGVSLDEAAAMPRLALPIDAVERLHPQRTLLFELLRPFGFSAVDVDSILESLHAPSGRQFLSRTHRIVKDRTSLEVASFAAVAPEPVLCYQTLERAALTSLKTPASEALFDADALSMPLHLRHWRQGDRFWPFGGRGSRLLSDFFTDSKLSLGEKERVWLLCDSQDRIVWVVGLRADHRFRVTAATQRVLKVSISK